MLTEVDRHNELLIPSDLDGEIVDLFLRKVSQQLDRGVDPLPVDCSQLIRVSSSHISVLMQVVKICSQRSVSVVLVSAAPSLMRVLDVLDLRGLFENEEVAGKTSRIRLTGLIDGPPRDEFVATFHPEASEIDSTMDKFLGFLLSNQAPEVSAFELQTVFYEVATNIRNHARLDPEDTIHFQASLHDGCIILVFEDKGIPFDLSKTPDPTDLVEAATEGRTRGYGLPMIHRLSDFVSYDRKDGTSNVATIEKDWR